MCTLNLSFEKWVKNFASINNYAQQHEWWKGSLDCQDAWLISLDKFSYAQPVAIYQWDRAIKSWDEAVSTANLWISQGK